MTGFHILLLQFRDDIPFVMNYTHIAESRFDKEDLNLLPGFFLSLNGVAAVAALQ